MKWFTVGLDFGTESARALLLDVKTGEEASVSMYSYPHGVLDRALPSGHALPPLWALQHPGDYLEATRELLSRMSAEAKRMEGEIIGIGLAFTASTVLPTRADGTPLALLDTPTTGRLFGRPGAFADHPHAYVKLWKHHASEPYAKAINEALPYFLKYYGGKTSAEWSLAKAWQLLEEAPEVWVATERWIEAGDWVVWQLIGEEVRSVCQAGYKAHWQPEWGGYPSGESLERLKPGLSAWLAKLAEPRPVGSTAGGLTRGWAEATGIKEGTAVAVAVIDAHAALPGVGVREPGTLVMVLGTSTPHMALSHQAVPTPGIPGIVPEGILPGYFGYECGQPATGDILAWWVRTLAWAGGVPEAKLYERLNYEAAQLEGPSGITALDWWNGCRTPLMDAGLKGVMSGLGLNTTPAQFYKALLEATAYGTRLVVETLEPAVGSIHEVRATGGLSRLPFIMQLYADILGREVTVSPTPHATAQGAAVYGAIAVGLEMPPPPSGWQMFKPQASAVYQEGYEAYQRLFAHFSQYKLAGPR